MNLIELRNSLNQFQKELLDEVVAFYMATQTGVLSRELYRRFKFQKPRVNECLKSLGSIIYEIEDHNAVSNRFEPTFLGLLVSSNGESYENMLVGFLEYLELLLKTKQDQHSVTSEEIGSILNLPKEEAFRFFGLLQKGNLCGNSGHHPTERTWNAQIFREVDDLPTWPSKHEFIHQRAMKSYNPSNPVFVEDRYQNTNATMPKTLVNASIVGGVHQVFVGSSSEAKATAKALIRDLANPKLNFRPWWDNVRPGRMFLSELDYMSNEASAALFLLTPDIHGCNRGKKAKYPNQNVLFELGYFFSRVRPDHIAIIRYGDTEIPNDLHGFTHIKGSRFFKAKFATITGKATKNDFLKWVSAL